MTTKVFLSWSGELSCKLAEALKEWFPNILQFVEPYFSPMDIEKGQKWSSEISEHLESTNIGLLCLTPENLNQPWIIFEAGALSKRIKESKVCTILFNINNADISGPLAIFQHTRFTKEDFKNLLISINNEGGELKLDDKRLDTVFEKWWPDLEQKVKNILNEEVKPKAVVPRKDREILEEVLDIVRSQQNSVKIKNYWFPDGMMEVVNSTLEYCELTIYARNKVGTDKYYFERILNLIIKLVIEVNHPNPALISFRKRAEKLLAQFEESKSNDIFS